MKRITLFLLSTVLALTVLAAPVEPKRAATVAANFWASHAGTKAAAVQLVDRTAEWSYAGIYLFTNPDGGFVLVAANDNATPILGYSMTGTLQPNALPEGLQGWLEGYQQQLEALATLPAGTKCAYGHDAELWQQLTEGLLPATSKGDTVGPLLSTVWNQTAPYNMYCPSGTVTGCAATAQAQMMNYWKFPAFGEGSYSYTMPTYGMQSADFAHTCFDWEHMPDTATMSSPLQERQAVARLMRVVGVSLEMTYGTAAAGGSSALGLVGMPGYHSIDNSLQDYFHYSRDMYVANKDANYTNAAWRELLISEIDLGRPVLYAGSSAQGGHGFVCDGYDDRQYMHFNFGWSGVGDGYYPVDSISPGVGGVGGNVTYTFNMYNTALIGAVPVYAMRVSDTLFSIGASGCVDSLLFSINDTVAAPWTVSCDVDWIALGESNFQRAGWVSFMVDTMTAYGERAGWITFSQGGEVLKVRVVQANFDTNEMCTLTVVMESTQGGGWEHDAYLSLESESGYVFGTATLAAGECDSVEIRVPPMNVYSVWHAGGGSDRFINYYVRNAYGQNCVEAVYAYRTGGKHLIASPCEQLAIEPEAAAQPVTLYPNPVGSVLHVKAEGLQRAEVIDMSGRVLLTATGNAIDLDGLPNGLYFVRVVTRDATTVQRIVKK